MSTTVDNADYGMLAAYKWHAHYGGAGLFYAVRNYKHHTLHMHREIIGSCLTGFEVDHINGNTLDNRRANLRITDRQGNNRNQRVRKDSESQYKGVRYYTERRKWAARIQVDHRRTFLGLFLSPENAAIAYNIAALKHFGEYAVLNIEGAPCAAANPRKN